MDERFADAGNGVTLCYETFGDPDGAPLLLVMGLGMQMLGWHEDFCRALADQGFHVIRYDNRDSGRSTFFDEVPPPTPRQIVTRRIGRPAYRLADMALDAAGLLGALGIESAHVVGASMGGMIAQTLAARHPGRVRSLTSIMSNTGGRLSGQPALKAYPVLLGKPPATREAYIDRSVKVFTLIGSPGFDRDTDELRDIAARSFDRSFNPAGTGRQLAAILASGDRRRELASVQAPTLVIHGAADVLVRPSGGRATAKAIKNARLMTVDGMGHDLPRGAWPQIVDAIAGHARDADAAGERGERATAAA